jgi:hypothetical protein
LNDYELGYVADVPAKANCSTALDFTLAWAGTKCGGARPDDPGEGTP